MSRPPAAGTYLYRVVDRHGQVIDVLVSTRRDAAAAQQFFARALRAGPSPVEVTTDRALVCPRVVEDLAAAARQVTEQYANNVIEADHGRLKSRLLTRRTEGTRHRERRLLEGNPRGVSPSALTFSVCPRDRLPGREPGRAASLTPPRRRDARAIRTPVLRRGSL
jgi:hypothetical protein